MTTAKQFDLQEFASEHYSHSSNRSLVSAVNQIIDVETLLGILGCGRLPLQRLAAKRLEKLDRNTDIYSLLQSGLQDAQTCRSVLTALSHLSLQIDHSTAETIIERLDDKDTETAIEAAKVIVHKLPHLIDAEIVPRLDSRCSRQLARVLCLSGRPDLIPKIVDQFGYPAQRLPPVIGLLVTPQWLAENVHESPELVDTLAEECGYCDGISISQAAEFWTQGLMFVGPAMVEADTSTSDLRKRVFELSFRLLPFDLEMPHRNDCAFDPCQHLDIELYLAALRETDRTNMDANRLRSPFDFRFQSNPRIVACSHATVRYVRKQFVQAPLQMAEELHVSKDHLGTFLIGHGRVELEIDEERRMEAELFFRSRWWAFGNSRDKSKHLPTISFPVQNVNDFPFGAQEFLERPIIHWDENPELSAGTNAICRLAMNVGREDLAEWLVRKENEWKGQLPPIGCELQIPQVELNTSLLRKQTLRQLGVPSPRRPEYRQMVEAAFRPTASWHAMILAPQLLMNLRIIDQPQEMALHISIQGEVDSNIRYLAACSSFIHPGKIRRPQSSYTRVMSKGLVCRNSDIEQCVPDFTSQYRTELRLFRCFCEVDDNDEIRLDLGYMDDVLATHLLLGAAMSSQKELREIYGEFTREIEQEFETLPAIFAEYLESDFFQSTGDPHDPEFLEVVPIFKKRMNLREVIDTEGLREQLSERFQSIRDNATWKLLCKLCGSEEAARVEWNPESEPHAVFPDDDSNRDT